MGTCTQRHLLNKIASRSCILAVECILELHHPGRPRHSTEAAAAHHQPAKPSVQRPHAPPPLLLHHPPQIQHPPARHSAHTKRRNLRSNALHTNEAARNTNMRRTSAERQQRGPSHRHAAAGVQSFKQIGQGPASRVSAGIGPEGVGGHAAAGGERAETRTRRLLLLLMQHTYDALKREGGGPCVACGAQRAAADTRNESEAPQRNAGRKACVMIDLVM